MSRTWYGSIQNRLEENRMYVDNIEIGTGVTEYSWSDRHPYEVIEVKDQKHVKVRELAHEHVGENHMDNNWKLISDENNPVRALTKRGNYWYWTVEITSDILENLESEDAEKRLHTSLFLCQNNVDAETLRSKKKITRYHKANVSFGVADYYYDYTF